MVGVAGRSKGCATCRRRKIRCDLARPACRRCSTSALVCEGYKRYPVFIIKNTSGVVKRLPLAEVIVDPIDDGFRRHPSRCDPETAYTSPKLVASLPSCKVEYDRFKYCFWESYSSSTPSEKTWNCTSRWLYRVLEQPAPQPALREALLAVSTMQYGKLKNDFTMLIEGRRLYTKALHLLQFALNDAASTQHDDTLSATGLMILYERFDCTVPSLDGWVSHMAGLARLLHQRGPKRHCTPSSRAALEYYRYVMMMQGLLQRQSAILSHPAWLTEPWEGIEKSVEQQVYDHGLVLAGVFEKVDTLSKFGSDGEQCLRAIEDSDNIRHAIERIIDEHLQPARETTNGMPQAANDHEIRAKLLLRIVALSIELGACISRYKAYSHLISRPGKISSSPSCDTSQASTHKQRALAMAIVGSIATYITGREEVVCNAKLIFSLGQAIEVLEPEDVQYTECISIAQRLQVHTWQFGVLVGSMGCLVNASGKTLDLRPSREGVS